MRLHFGWHPSDAQLSGLLDRQLDVRTRQRLKAHVAGCRACALRLEELERASTLARQALAAVPVQLPDASRRALALSAMERVRRRRPGRPGTPPRTWMLRAAAVAALLLVAAVSARPSRAWMLRGVERAAVEVGLPRVAEWLMEPAGAERAGSAPTAAGAPSPRGAPASGLVREGLAGRSTPPPLQRTAPAVRTPVPPRRHAPLAFDPVGEEMVLEFDSYQQEGTLSLWIMDVPSASVQVTEGARGETFHVLRRGLRIHNTEGSAARYEVVVPRGVRNVRIRIAGSSKAWIGIEPATPGQQPWLWTVDLQRRRAP